MDSDLNLIIDSYISLESEINALIEELKPKTQRLKELKIKQLECKNNIEELLITKEIENYKYKEYSFGISEKKIKNKPKPEEYNNIIYSELKTKMEKEEAQKSTNNITMEIVGGEVQKVKKINVRKPRKKAETKKGNNKKNNKKSSDTKDI